MAQAKVSRRLRLAMTLDDWARFEALRALFQAEQGLVMTDADVIYCCVQFVTRRMCELRWWPTSDAENTPPGDVA